MKKKATKKKKSPSSLSSFASNSDCGANSNKTKASNESNIQTASPSTNQISHSARRQTMYAGAAALLAVIIPLLFFHDFTSLPFVSPKSSKSFQSDNLPSSAPHVAPSTSDSTVDYEAGLSSFDNYEDPDLVNMNFTLPGETESRTFKAYVTPHVSTFYRDEKKNRKRKKMSYKGLAGKFINMSPEAMVLNWDDGNGGGVFIGNAGPFEVVATATHPGHEFYFSPESNPDEIKWRCRVVEGQSIYFYDPFSENDSSSEPKSAPPRSVSTMNKKERKKYKIQKRSLAFSDEYQKVTGREYLGLYPRRPAPMHKMWNADYFGQQQWVSTSETHFTNLPPESELEHIPHHELNRRLADSEPRPLPQYRSSAGALNLTLTVLSCAPRIFEIRNFLSPVEVDHIVHMATGMKLHVSSTSGGTGKNNRRTTDSATRSSKNSWVERGRSVVIDGIYRRAADLMRIDEALLRGREKGERPDLGYLDNAAESLQLVHYGPGQQYTPHHDFMHPRIGVEGQPARFATLLLYLNEDMEGGATEFQRWMNSETSKPLSVKPEVGKAVLFYDLLPDGNMDDLSQHSATPVIKGEKWLINLWTWDQYHYQ